ncbi:hypothetical protein CEXT_754201 [Caerostris extrusa]|uniref:Uncharacterized protein n=1 Tax=Caerostris extrusa TaxID=172846 RepID=A0AAV4MST3_CAEEX|nr:hypothetical protein CEXT_754201 [Caerostris extrusa]
MFDYRILLAALKAVWAQKVLCLWCTTEAFCIGASDRNSCFNPSQLKQFTSDSKRRTLNNVLTELFNRCGQDCFRLCVRYRSFVQNFLDLAPPFCIGSSDINSYFNPPRLKQFTSDSKRRALNNVLTEFVRRVREVLGENFLDLAPVFFNPRQND